MNIENLKEGMVIKNYKELCKLLDEKVKGGASKRSQLKDWKEYFDYERDGYKYIITRIKNCTIPIQDLKYIRRCGMNNHNYKKYDNLLVDEIDMHHKGVYGIINDINKDVYIGSTKVGFRDRFQQHLYGLDKLMTFTKDMLNEGAYFTIIQDMNDIEDIDLIRMVESEYIKYFICQKEWNVRNRQTYIKRNGKPKIKTIKITEDKYIQALQLLINNNLIDESEVNL